MIRSSHLPQLDLARHRFDLPLLVDMEAFFDFSFWIAEELLDLEAEFKCKHSGRLEPSVNSKHGRLPACR